MPVKLSRSQPRALLYPSAVQPSRPARTL